MDIQSFHSTVGGGLGNRLLDLLELFRHVELHEDQALAKNNWDWVTWPNNFNCQCDFHDIFNIIDSQRFQVIQSNQTETPKGVQVCRTSEPPWQQLVRERRLWARMFRCIQFKATETASQPADIAIHLRGTDAPGGFSAAACRAFMRTFVKTHLPRPQSILLCTNDQTLLDVCIVEFGEYHVPREYCTVGKIMPGGWHLSAPVAGIRRYNVWRSKTQVQAAVEDLVRMTRAKQLFGGPSSKGSTFYQCAVALRSAKLLI